ncbi:MAG: dTDP-4-dehydrorhamnose reductase [Vicinamibacteria bacterium]
MGLGLNNEPGVEAGTRPMLVTGAAGQLGQVAAVALARRWPVVALTREGLDVTDAAAVRRVVDAHRPAAIVNCVGFNEVDRAEDEAALALEVNALAVRTLARAAADAGAALVHYSSDFVFDGETDRPYREDDRPQPRSVYAASKLLGEWFAADAPRHYVLRVESLFGGLGKRTSSFDKIVDLVAAGGPVKVFTDRVVSPSYVWDVAEATAHLLATEAAPGVYHCVSSGAATWYEVAETVARRLGVAATLEPIRLADLTLPAARPRYCALANDKLAAAGMVMPTWQDALDRYLASRDDAAN